MKNRILSVLFMCSTTLMSTEQALGMKPVAQPAVQATVAPARAAAGPTAHTSEAKTATEPAIHAPLWPVVRGRLSVGGKKPTLSADEEKTLLAEIERDANDLPLLRKHARNAAACGSIIAFDDLLNRELFRPYLTDPKNTDGQALARELFTTAGHEGYAEICEHLLRFTSIDTKAFSTVLHGKLFAIAESLILRFKHGTFHGIMYEALQATLSDKNPAGCDFILGKLSHDQAKMILTDRVIFGLAAEHGALTVVERCLTSGIKPDVPVGEQTWKTALYYAAKKTQVAVCKVLVQNGATVFDTWESHIQVFARESWK